MLGQSEEITIVFVQSAGSIHTISRAMNNEYVSPSEFVSMLVGWADENASDVHWIKISKLIS